MIFGSFLKGAKPWTRKQNIWFGAYAVACLTFVGVVIAYEIWAQTSIFEIRSIRVQWVSVLSLPCSPEHFWGQAITYKRLTDDYERYGVLCRDWKNGRWILMDSRTPL